MRPQQYSQAGQNECEADEAESQGEKAELGSKGASCRKALIVSFLIISAFIIGLVVGLATLGLHKQRSNPGDAVPRVPLADTRVIYHYNTTFARQPPQTGSERLWDSLIPNGLGYVANTPISTETSMLGVFHQLHCLYTIRRAFYDEGDDGELREFDFNKIRREHIPHCFDYLTQSILCSADSNLEPAVDETNGFLGSDVPRQCRDFDALKSWAEQWRAFDATGFLAVGHHIAEEAPRPGPQPDA